MPNVLCDAIDLQPGLVFVESIAYQFAQMALFNLSRVCLDEGMVEQLRYHAALGLMKGAADGLAVLKADQLHIDDERKN